MGCVCVCVRAQCLICNVDALLKPGADPDFWKGKGGGGGGAKPKHPFEVEKGEENSKRYI